VGSKRKKNARPWSHVSKETASQARQGKISEKGDKSRVGRGLPLRVLLPFLILFGVGSLLYINSIHNDFVFDDISLIVKNKSIRSVANIPDILGITSGRIHYRPLRVISYVVDYQLTGMRPEGYHLFNILYHVLASCMVFLIAQALTKNRTVAWAAALLFIAHPIQTESVTYIAGRRDILSGLFFFVGFYFFLKQRTSPSKKYLILIVLSYLLSLLSKEMGVTLPALMFVYDILMDPEDSQGSRNWPGAWISKVKGVLKKHWAFYLTFLLMVAFFTVYHVFLRKASRQQEFYGGTMASNFSTVLNIWIFYIKMLFLPVSLNASHTFTLSRSFFEWRTISSIFLLLALFSLLIGLTIKRREIWAFGGFWFFITLLPVSHIFPHHELAAEHYLYIPSFGFALVLALCFAALLRNSRWKPLVVSCFAAVLVFYGYQTVRRNLDWKDELTLWSDSVRKSPDSYRATLSLGVSFMARRDYDKAIEQFKNSIRIRNNNPLAYNNLGVISLERNDPAQAAVEFNRAIVCNPRYPEAYNNLAKALAALGRTNEAIGQVRTAVSLSPRTAAYHFNLARLYDMEQRFQEAVPEYREAVRLEPELFEAHYYLGMAYTRLQNPEEAVRAFEHAARLEPGSGQIYFMLGFNQIKLGEREAGRKNLERALFLVQNENDRQKIRSVLAQLDANPK
jgi:protein O-mannosyl-transferase